VDKPFPLLSFFQPNTLSFPESGFVENSFSNFLENYTLEYFRGQEKIGFEEAFL